MVQRRKENGKFQTRRKVQKLIGKTDWKEVCRMEGANIRNYAAHENFEWKNWRCSERKTKIARRSQRGWKIVTTTNQRFGHSKTIESKWSWEIWSREKINWSKIGNWKERAISAEKEVKTEKAFQEELRKTEEALKKQLKLQTEALEAEKITHEKIRKLENDKASQLIEAGKVETENLKLQAQLKAFQQRNAELEAQKRKDEPL